MSLLDTLTFGYSVVPVIYVFGYGPQLRSLYLEKAKLENFPFATWFMWLFAAVISSAYGHLVVADNLITMTGLSNALPIMAVMILAAYKAELFKSRTSGLKVNARVNPDIHQIAYQMHNQANQREYVQRAQNDGVVAVNHTLIAEQSQTIQ